MLGGKSLQAKIFGAPLYLARDAIRPHINRFRRTRSGHLLAVDLNSWVGIFAHLEWFLEISLFCERNGRTPCFMSTSPQYVDHRKGPDWFDYFFENRQLKPEDVEIIRQGRVPVCRIEGIRHLGLPENYDKQLSLDIASQLVRKYIGVKSGVSQYVDAFVERHLTRRCVLGLHYRGTDKQAEAPRLPYIEIRNVLDRFLTNNTNFHSIFVSSDEQRFVDFIEKEFGHTLPVVYHEDHERSRTNIAVHRSASGDRFRKAEEAVVNCLLLARCDALMKTPSILSGWSKLFNPDLSVFMLSRPFADQLWFPDRDLVLEAPPRWVTG